MARIFNIYFSYEQVTHSAIVSVRETPLFTEYKLNNLNDTLLQLLPGDKIIRKSGQKNIFFQNSPQQNTSILMDEIIGAVQQHLTGVVVN